MMVLHWNDGETKQTIFMNKGTNTPIVQSSQGANLYQLFEVIFNARYQPDITACTSVYDYAYKQERFGLIRNTPFPVSDLDDMIQEEDTKLSMTDPKADLLCWHYRLGHISFKTIKLLSVAGVLPKRLMKAQVPKCAACQYGLMTINHGEAKPL